MKIRCFRIYIDYSEVLGHGDCHSVLLKAQVVDDWNDQDIIKLAYDNALLDKYDTVVAHLDVFKIHRSEFSTCDSEFLIRKLDLTTKVKKVQYMSPEGFPPEMIEGCWINPKVEEAYNDKVKDCTTNTLIETNIKQG